MKFTINYADALKLQKRISKNKSHMTAISDVTVRVRQDGRTDVFATDGQIMGAYFTREELAQEQMDLDIYEQEAIFTVDLRPLDKIKKMITGNDYIACELKEDMLRIKLNNFGEEIKLRTDRNTVFDKFLEILDYDKYTSDFSGETFIKTDLLDKVAFGEEIRLQRGIDDTNRFLVTDTEYNYRGVILGKTVIEDEEPEETNPVEGLPFDKEMEYYDKSIEVIKDKYEEKRQLDNEESKEK